MKSLFVLVILAVVGFLLVTVWPTMYQVEQKGPATIRTHRFTGDVELRTTKGWLLIKKTDDIALDPSKRYSEETGISKFGK